MLEALREEGGVLGGEQSGHIVWLRDHVTGDGLVASLLLCGALAGRTLSEAAATMTRYPQAKQNVRVSHRLAAGELPRAVRDEADRLNAELGDHGRVLVRSSGTEPVVRVLAEAATEEEAERISATIARARCQGARLSPTEGVAGLLRVSISVFAGILRQGRTRHQAN